MKSLKEKHKFRSLWSFIKAYKLILFLLLLTFVLRIYRLEELFYFTYDEEIPAFVGKRLILLSHLSLIGGVTPFGFHLAPYFYWLSASILWLGNLNPIAWGWAGAFFSIFTTLMIFLVGRKVAGKKVGFIAATLWTFSFLANVYDRHFWALYWGPLGALLVIFALLKIIEKREKYIYLLAFTLAFTLHADLSNYIFLILTAVCWIIYRLPFSKHTVISVMIIFLSFTPLAIFDLKHDFANTRPVLEYFQTSHERKNIQENIFVNNIFIFPKTLSHLVYNFGDGEISKVYSYCESYVMEKSQSVPWLAVFIAAILLFIYIYKSFKQKKKTGAQIISLTLILYFGGLNIYGGIFKGPIYEHYLTGLLPLFLLIVANFVGHLSRKLLFFTLFLFISLNLSKLITAENSFGLTYKREAIEYTMKQVGNNEFSLDSVSTCWKYNGYRYLFGVFGREPVKSYVDPDLAYLYGETAVSDKHPKFVVSFVASDFKRETDEVYNTYNLYKEHTLNTQRFGRMEVLILDNSSDWFNKQSFSPSKQRFSSSKLNDKNN